jgi:hypothetical protein
MPRGVPRRRRNKSWALVTFENAAAAKKAVTVGNNTTGVMVTRTTNSARGSSRVIVKPAKTPAEMTQVAPR